LKKGREKSLLHRHPWVFSGAVEAVDGDADGEATAGEVVDVVDADGNWLVRGYYNAGSNIRVRALEWRKAVVVDEAWWRQRITQAVERRSGFAGAEKTNAYRLVNAEADLLPGLVADRYGDYVVVRLLTAGVERVRDVVVDCLNGLLEPVAVIDRSDAGSRRREKLEPSTGLISGMAPDGPVEIVEAGRRFLVDVAAGQKTGFYLDRRSGRELIGGWARGEDVLDAFCYSGAFSVVCGGAGAKSLSLVESSRTAMELAEQNLALNQVGADAELLQGDVFEVLRAWRDESRQFGLVILDPPEFARSRAQADQAMRGYKDVNMLAMKMLRPGGILATFSCSGGVDAQQFARSVSWAALDAGREVQILRRVGQPEDHPALVSAPETESLKGLICRLL
jgi:23S rRNA (cytosine1962-C5)-methyltransferase